MAFILGMGNTVLSFAEYSDVTERDQRLFESNEGFTQSNIEDLLILATDRILNKIRASDWWVTYYTRQSGNVSAYVNSVGGLSVPAVDPKKIMNRKQEFTDLCVYWTLAEYILPKVADFANPESAERLKIDFYTAKSSMLLTELIQDGDWYDFDGSGTVTASEKAPTLLNIRRLR